MSNIITVTKTALSELVNEVLDNKALATTVMSPFALSHQVNPGVSQNVAFDSPLNANFVPQDKAEFIVSIQKAIERFEEKEIPKLWKSVLETLKQFEIDPENRIVNDKQRMDAEKRQAACGGGKKRDGRNMSDTKEEALVREAVRRMLREAPAMSAAERDAKRDYEREEKENFDDLDVDTSWKGKTEDEKNVMGEVPARKMAEILGLAGSTYVKGEQQVLNKYLNGLLSPESRQVFEDSKRSMFIRFMIKEYLDSLAVLFSTSDPDVEDPDHQQFLLALSTNYPKLEFQTFESEPFGDWYNESVAAALAEGDEEYNDLIDELNLTDIKQLRELGKGYIRFDQSKGDYERLLKKYQKSDINPDDDSEVLIPKKPLALGVGTGGRKAQAARATGKAPKETK